MAVTSSRKSSQAKVSAHRRRLRAQGLRPNEDQSFIDVVSDLCPGREP
jgi:hypothetical protein